MGSRGALGGEVVGHGGWLEFGRVKEKLMTEADQGPGISETLQILGIQYAPFQRDGLCVIPAGTV